MSDGLDDFLNSDDDSNDSGPGQDGKGLRAQLTAALAREKALNDRLVKTEAAERARSLSDLFTKHSVPDLARDFFPKDAELTDESVTGFVEKYGQLWGAQAQPATTPPDQQAAAAAMQQFASQANPAPVAPLSEDAYRAKFAEAQTRDEFLKMLAEFGGA